MTKGATAALDGRLAQALAAHGLEGFELAYVLGSGLGAFAEGLEDALEVPFGEVDGMPTSSVPGHAGRFVLGTLAGVRVLVQQGRVHLYEGCNPDQVTASVRAFARLGCRALLLTNAAGGLDPDWSLPCLMRITDHVNLQGSAPLKYSERGHGTPYHPAMGEALVEAAAAADVELKSGVYLGLSGPAYETPAEIGYFARCGIQAVGMSTVAEAAAAHAVGLRVAGLSCITNPGAGLAAGPLSHDEVVEAGAAIASLAGRLLAEAGPRLVAASTA